VNAVGREMWEALNSLHAIVYFDPEPSEAYGEIGLKGWSTYFASRAAAMGAVTAPVVAAAFYGFDPRLATKALGGVWDRTTPAAVLQARLRGVDAALRRRLGDAVSSAEVARAGDLVAHAMDGLDGAGRPLFAAHAALDPPSPPHLALWHAATLYREYRGDAHVAALVAAGIGGIESIVLHARAGDGNEDFLRTARGWPAEDWMAAERALVARGLLAADGTATTAGRSLRASLEDDTDAATSAPWARLTASEINELRTCLATVRAAASV
jgi:helix-turn-helix protein